MIVRPVVVEPAPRPLEERVAADLLPRRPLGDQLLLDDVLRRDAGVVVAGLPERVEAAHPVPADQHVLDRAVERVAHVQLAGHVRRRHADHERSRRGGARRRRRRGRRPPRPPASAVRRRTGRRASPSAAESRERARPAARVASGPVALPHVSRVPRATITRIVLVACARSRSAGVLDAGLGGDDRPPAVDDRADAPYGPRLGRDRPREVRLELERRPARAGLRVRHERGAHRRVEQRRREPRVHASRSGCSAPRPGPPPTRRAPAPPRRSRMLISARDRRQRQLTRDHALRASRGPGARTPRPSASPGSDHENVRERGSATETRVRRCRRRRRRARRPARRA